LGTPDYIAPEQTQDAASADIRADIYSLGCTLYFLLTGRPPFQAKSVFGLLAAHQEQIATPLNEMRPDVPAELAAIAAKMMAKLPGERYQKPVEVAQVLAPFFKTGLKPLPAVGPGVKGEVKERGTLHAPVGQPPLPKTMIEQPLRPAPTVFGGRRPPAPRSRPVVARRSGSWLLGCALAAAVLLMVAGGVGLWLAGVLPIKATGDVAVVEGGTEATANSPEKNPKNAAPKTNAKISNDGSTPSGGGSDLKGTQKKPTDKSKDQPGKKEQVISAVLEKGTFTTSAQLAASDFEDPILRAKRKVYVVELQTARKYKIDLVSDDFDAFLRLEDSDGKEIARDDNSGGGHNARLLIAPSQSGSYRVIATSLGGTTGKFTLTIAQEDPLIAGMKFVHVPKGMFWMSKDGKNAQVQVAIKEDFELAAYTVTQEQWQAVMGDNPSYFSRNGKGKEQVKDVSDEDLKRFPVENVSWNDVQAFLQKLNAQQKGKGWLYRLPSEAEWEYACRGAATSKEECSFDFYLEKPTNDLSWGQANFWSENPAGNGKKGEPLKRTTKVGSYAPNKLGLHDMHGNVWQWCADLYDGTGSDRVIRGGSGGDDGSYCRAALRRRFGPEVRIFLLGFRLVRVPSL
jgi:formylglycine-generating enzyme required for sulfatase activity